MAFYISEDKIGEGEDNGFCYSNFRDGENSLERCKKVCKHKFRMLDDDGEIYYYGYSNDKDSDKAFAPLDDFGMPNAGCTEIQYYENGEWRTL